MRRLAAIWRLIKPRTLAVQQDGRGLRRFERLIREEAHSYALVNMDDPKKRWFCTSEEVEAAGWRRALRWRDVAEGAAPEVDDLALNELPKGSSIEVHSINPLEAPQPRDPSGVPMEAFTLGSYAVAESGW